MPFANPGQTPSSATQLFILEVGKERVGFLQSVDFPTTTQLTAQFGTGMSKSFYDWVSLCCQGMPVPKPGSLGTLNFQGKEIARVAWNSGQIGELGFPALDAASRNPCTIGITVDIRNAGVAASSSVPSMRVQQKRLLSCNFRLEIDGVEGSRVKTIGAFGLRHGRPSGPLVLTVSELHAGTFRAWQGAPGAKNASLDYLAPNMTPLLTLKFNNLTIAGIDPAFPMGNANATVRLKFSGLSLAAATAATQAYR
jgi:hypothetical protein